MEILQKLLQELLITLPQYSEVLISIGQILKKEEEYLESLNLNDLQKTLSQKNLLQNKLRYTEERRKFLFHKILPLTGYSGEEPSLQEFIIILENYQNRIQSLIDKEHLQSLRDITHKLKDVAQNSLQIFKDIHPIIEQNQNLLEKLYKSFQLSFQHLLSFMKEGPMTSYGVEGKPQFSQNYSLIQVKA